MTERHEGGLFRKGGDLLFSVQARRAGTDSGIVAVRSEASFQVQGRTQDPVVSFNARPTFAFEVYDLALRSKRAKRTGQLPGIDQLPPGFWHSPVRFTALAYFAMRMGMQNKERESEGESVCEEERRARFRHATGDCAWPHTLKRPWLKRQRPFSYSWGFPGTVFHRTHFSHR